MHRLREKLGPSRRTAPIDPYPCPAQTILLPPSCRALKIRLWRILSYSLGREHTLGFDPVNGTSSSPLADMTTAPISAALRNTAYILGAIRPCSTATTRLARYMVPA